MKALAVVMRLLLKVAGYFHQEAFYCGKVFENNTVLLFEKISNVVSHSPDNKLEEIYRA